MSIPTLVPFTAKNMFMTMHEGEALKGWLDSITKNRLSFSKEINFDINKINRLFKKETIPLEVKQEFLEAVSRSPKAEELGISGVSIRDIFAGDYNKIEGDNNNFATKKGRISVGASDYQKLKDRAEELEKEVKHWIDKYELLKQQLKDKEEIIRLLKS